MLEENRPINDAKLFRESLVTQVEKMSWPQLLEQLNQYENSIKPAQYQENPDEKLFEYNAARSEMGQFPDTDLRQEIVMGRIIRLGQDHAGKEPFAKKAQDFLIKSKLKWIFTIALDYRWTLSPRNSLLDLYQEGCAKFIKTFPGWHYEDGALTTYMNSGIKQAMIDLFRSDVSKTPADNKIFLRIKEAEEAWETIHYAIPTPKQLAQQIALFYFQPNLRLNEKQQRLKTVLTALITDLRLVEKVRPDVGIFTSRAENRLEFYHDLRQKGQPISGDEALDSEDGDETLFDLIGADPESYGDAANMAQLKTIFDKALQNLTQKMKSVLVFMFDPVFSGETQPTIKQLANHLQVSETAARKLYNRAMTKFRAQKMAMKEILEGL